MVLKVIDQHGFQGVEVASLVLFLSGSVRWFLHHEIANIGSSSTIDPSPSSTSCNSIEMVLRTRPRAFATFKYLPTERQGLSIFISSNPILH